MLQAGAAVAEVTYANRFARIGDMVLTMILGIDGSSRPCIYPGATASLLVISVV